MTSTPILPLVTAHDSTYHETDRDAQPKAHIIRRIYKSFSLSTKLVLALLITIMLLLIVQERYQLQFDILSSPVPMKSDTIKPRIFDIILFNTELDWLEIRLKELHESVDYFVVIESALTFTKNPKPLNFRLNEHRFKSFRHQILHVVVPTSELSDLSNTWDIEKWTRSYGFSEALDIHKPVEGDWLMLSDLDEVPRASTVNAMKNPSRLSYPGRLFGDGTIGSGGDLFRLGCQFYYYSFEYRHEGSLWNGPVIIRYREPDSRQLSRQRNEAQRNAIQDIMKDDWKDAGTKLREYRIKDEATFVDDACFHCSWCFSNLTQVVNKVEAYSHTEHNQEKYKDRSWILDRFRNGQDLFEREWDTFEYVENNLDLPQYVLDNQDRFEYMLSRRGKANAGFIDVDPNDTQ